MDKKINGAAGTAFVFFTNLTTYNALVGTAPATLVCALMSVLSFTVFCASLED